ncbi:MAG: DUF4142 domain-containing protein [Hyphomicrobiales bacterium]|nr:DUF4142 domain-containing protein [Hyphomicrobiales bacterium]
MRFASILAFMAFASVGPALADAADPPKTFVTEAIEGDISEIMLGRLAAQRGDAQGVRDFGNMLSDDHMKAKDQMVALAGELGAKSPIAPTHDAQDAYTRLSGLSGPQFDSEFVAYMVKDHQEDIRKFQAERDAGNGKVSDLAKEQLPILQKHLKMAQSLQKQASD